jgi:RNA polymerase sigma factor (TIGR02999 family)
MSEVKITHILNKVKEGVPGATTELWDMTYGNLRRLAAARMVSENPGHILQPTALAHEAFLEMKDRVGKIDNTGHFFKEASVIMRNTLINIARGEKAEKRGGGVKPVSLDDIDVASPNTPPEIILGMDEALTKFAKDYPREAEVIHYRFFVGLTLPEIAKQTDISVATLKRDWAFAKGWLARELKSQAAASEK